MFDKWQIVVYNSNVKELINMYKLMTVLATSMLLFGCQAERTSETDDSKWFVKNKFEITNKWGNVQDWRPDFSVQEIRDVDTGVHYYYFKKYGGYTGVVPVYINETEVKVTRGDE